MPVNIVDIVQSARGVEVRKFDPSAKSLAAEINDEKNPSTATDANQTRDNYGVARSAIASIAKVKSGLAEAQNALDSAGKTVYSMVELADEASRGGTTGDRKSALKSKYSELMTEMGEIAANPELAAVRGDGISLAGGTERDVKLRTYKIESDDEQPALQSVFDGIALTSIDTPAAAAASNNTLQNAAERFKEANNEMQNFRNEIDSIEEKYINRQASQKTAFNRITNEKELDAELDSVRFEINLQKEAFLKAHSDYMNKMAAPFLSA